MKISKINSTINLGQLLCGGFLATFLITYVYAKSIYFAYVCLSFVLMAFTYVRFFKDYYIIDKSCRILILIVMGISFINGFFRWNIKSTFMLNTSLILAFSISTLNIRIVKVKKGLIWSCIIALLCVVAQVEFDVFGYINSNTFSFLAYMGVSIAFIWFIYAKNKLFPVLCLLVGFYGILRTGSRNVAIIMLICFILLLVPQKIWENPWFYRTVYILAILYTVFAIYIMEAGFDNSRISTFLDEYVARFSKKAWEMESRVEFLLGIKYRLHNASIIEQFVGTGIMEHHGHNLFYQSVFTYGYFGTLLIYITYFIMFEMGYQVIKKEKNPIVLGCVIIMVGHFLIQGADVYMLGSECCNVMPFVTMGIIMQQYRVRNSK